VHYAGGANPWTVESKGIPTGVTEQIVVTRYNDANMLREHFKQYGDQLACLIVEPFMGSGGFMPARSEFLRAARELTDQYGVVLICDEIISGFRFRAGNLSALFGVQPDLATFAKIMGGGMPVAAVAGRADIMKLCGRDGGNQVSFPGGTYSAHPAALLAAKTLIEYLVEHEQEIYPRIARLGAAARRTVEKAFADEGIYVRCTGCNDDVVRDSSFAVPQFLRQEGSPIDSPDDVNDPARSDVTLREKVIRLALLLEDVHIVHGGGAISTTHTEQDIAFWGEACRRAARRIQAYQAN
jgi:glutamate-1-semialdehyde 2,1-aminomutase